MAPLQWRSVKRTVPRLDGAARNVARGELIGLAVRVAGSTDKGLIGMSGKVVDETLRTLTIARDDARESVVGKVGQTFEFTTAQGKVLVEGAAIEFRPDERAKKVR